jgi:hypothetical protein
MSQMMNRLTMLLTTRAMARHRLLSKAKLFSRWYFSLRFSLEFIKQKKPLLKLFSRGFFMHCLIEKKVNKAGQTSFLKL